MFPIQDFTRSLEKQMVRENINMGMINSQQQDSEFWHFDKKIAELDEVVEELERFSSSRLRIWLKIIHQSWAETISVKYFSKWWIKKVSLMANFLIKEDDPAFWTLVSNLTSY